MAEKKVPTTYFVEQLEAAKDRKDGYIMCATGQNPRKWAESSWWFHQYDGDKKALKQALYWREHAARVWDCNGLAEGIYKDYTGIDINTKARYNYAQWCDPKGTGLIPAEYRVPGAAVFWGDKAADITHVAYLEKPVDPSKPEGDWYLIEARGVFYGVVQTKLNERKPKFWGWMTKYFDYSSETVYLDQDEFLGYRTLKNGSEGEDVKELQVKLIRLGYDLGKWGADGDFGDMTEMAVAEFQKAKKLEVTGIADKATIDALDAAIVNYDKPVPNPRKVEIVDGNCYVRSAPKKTAKVLGVAHCGEKYDYQGNTSEDGWNLIDFDNQNGWVSGKYSRLVK